MEKLEVYELIKKILFDLTAAQKLILMPGEYEDLVRELADMLGI